MPDVALLLIKEPIVEWLRDGSEKPGEGFVLLALCRTCSVQPGLWMSNELKDDSPKIAGTLGMLSGQAKFILLAFNKFY